MTSDRVSGKDKVGQSRAMDQLKEWGLVEERRSGKETEYRLTSDGIFAKTILQSQRAPRGMKV